MTTPSLTTNASAATAQIPKRKEALMKQLKAAWRNAYALSKVSEGLQSTLAGIEDAISNLESH